MSAMSHFVLYKTAGECPKIRPQCFKKGKKITTLGIKNLFMALPMCLALKGALSKETEQKYLQVSGAVVCTVRGCPTEKSRFLILPRLQLSYPYKQQPKSCP